MSKNFDLNAFKAEVEKEVRNLERTQSLTISKPLFYIFEPSPAAVAGLLAYSPWLSFISAISKPPKGFVESSKWFIQNLENWLKKRQYETQQWLESQIWSSTRFSEWLTLILEEWRQQVKTEIEETQKWLKDLYLETKWYQRRTWRDQQWQTWREQQWENWKNTRGRDFQEWQKQAEYRWQQERWKIIRHEQEQWLKELLQLGFDREAWQEKQKQNTEERQIELAEYEQLRRERAKLSEEKAKQLLNRKDIIAYLCPALQTVSNDVFAIGNTISQVIVPLVIAQTLSVPLVPILIASMAMLIMRLGISTLCANYNSK
ncbi:MAG: hypothetical protein QNJ55_22485 [Xenococcus sp. MO_188.B8]|nr:hypothetical protein [Xenococcus sp. MO_188.B8]